MKNSPLNKYLALRTAKGFNIAGREMSEVEIAAAFEDDFQVSIRTVKQRVKLDGMSPEDAVLMPRSDIKSMGVHTKLLSGWKHWCREYDVPTTESDLVTRVERDLFNLGNWALRDGTAFCESATKSGIRSLGHRLLTHHYNQTAVCVMWVEAAMNAYEIYHHSVKVDGRSGYPGGCPPHFPGAEEYIGYDPRTTHFLPWGTVTTQNERGVLEGELDRFAPLTAPHRPEYGWRQEQDVFALVGLAVAIRKMVRREYVLVVESDSFLDQQYRRMRDVNVFLDRSGPT
jgi:hypothetical protein